MTLVFIVCFLEDLYNNSAVGDCFLAKIVVNLIVI